MRDRQTLRAAARSIETQSVPGAVARSADDGLKSLGEASAVSRHCALGASRRQRLDTEAARAADARRRVGGYVERRGGGERWLVRIAQKRAALRMAHGEPRQECQQSCAE